MASKMTSRFKSTLLISMAWILAIHNILYTDFAGLPNIASK
jgi:hypothetical protein